MRAPHGWQDVSTNHQILATCRAPHRCCPEASRGAMPRPTLPPPRCVKAQAKKPTPEQADITEHVDQSSYFPGLMSRLLWNASSMRDRGKASCNICKTAGNVVCPECGGARVLSKASKRAQAHARARLASFLEDVDQPRYRDEWLVTNRCPRCHGAGVMTCPACGGEGYRHQ